MGWRGWSGGVALLIGCVAPATLLAVRHQGSLTVHLGSNFAFDVAAMLSALPGVAVFALLAPLVGYRRRDALLMAIPVANIYLAWVAGARVVQLRRGDGPQRWAGLEKPPRPRY
jgi:ABC-type proline/glycine betaine transport system permease subunit